MMRTFPSAKRAASKTDTRRGSKATRVPEILQTAARLLARQGYAAFTTRRVAEEEGIRLSTLQHYFPTREELLSRTLSGLIERYAALFRGATDIAGVPPEARLQALIDAGMAELTAPEVADFWIEVWAMGRHVPFARQLATEAYELGTREIARLIAEINPRLGARECADRARTISIQFEGLMVLAHRYRAGAEFDAGLAAAKAVCWAVVRAKP